MQLLDTMLKSGKTWYHAVLIAISANPRVGHMINSLRFPSHGGTGIIVCRWAQDLTSTDLMQMSLGMSDCYFCFLQCKAIIAAALCA